MPNNETIRGTDGTDELAGRDGDDVVFGYQVEDPSATAGIINAVRVGTGFESAVAAVAAPGDPGFLYVVEKDSGDIYRLDLSNGSKTLFLDIDAASELTTGNEQGLLSLAFHPDYETNGRFFVHLVNSDGDLELREYARAAMGVPPVADNAPVDTLLTIPHPEHENHNGGTLAFGPNDGFLYYSLGDGGGGNDEEGNSQDLDSLLGKILRLDVNSDEFPMDPDRNYAIPDDNPFVGTAGADEIWAYGVRNPWRMSFDSETGDLYIGDVGQAAREEIDFQPANSVGGENYGWPNREGSLGNDPPGGSTDPVFDYSHDLGEAVTGGVVYRVDGAAMDGHYFFADFISGRIWSLEIVNGNATHVSERTDQVVADAGSVTNIASFSTDAAGNMYAISLGGDIFRLTPTELSADLADTLEGNAGNDQLFGGAGNDKLIGGGDKDKLSGGFGDDHLKGNSGKDKLEGDSGADVLNGGGGEDRFLFTAELGDTNVDKVKDFSKGDGIKLAQTVFSDLSLGTLGADQFAIGSDAEDGADRIIYNKNTGELKYDADGTGTDDAVVFAVLGKNLKIDSDTFTVF